MIRIERIWLTALVWALAAIAIGEVSMSISYTLLGALGGFLWCTYWMMTHDNLPKWIQEVKEEPPSK